MENFEEEEIEMTLEEEAYLLNKIQLSLKAEKNGEVYTEEEMDAIVSKWQNKRFHF
jgi:predicted transcriptional regulator